MSVDGFLGGLLRRDADEDGGTVVRASGEGMIAGGRGSARRGPVPREGHRPPRDLTVERLAGAIADLPPDVPRESAVLIVRKTLDAAGVRLSEVDASTREQESRLGYEIGLAEERRKEFREKAQETVRSLEEEIRKAREACEDVVAYEERKISRDLALLGEVRRVRAFFELPDTEGGEGAGPAEVEGDDAGSAEVYELPGSTERDAQQAREPLDATKARQVRAFFELPEAEGGDGAGPAGRGSQHIPNPSNAVEEGRRISDEPFGPGAGG